MPRKPSTPEDRVRRATKKLEYWLETLEEALEDNNGYVAERATLRGLSGTVKIAIRVKRSDKHYKWAMAVLFNNQRVDGIDWEPLVRDHRGKKHNCTGWHRHIWTAATADTLKECLREFNPSTVREFILSGFKILNVQLRKGETGAKQLRIH